MHFTSLNCFSGKSNGNWNFMSREKCDLYFDEQFLFAKFFGNSLMNKIGVVHSDILKVLRLKTFD